MGTGTKITICKNSIQAPGSVGAEGVRTFSSLASLDFALVVKSRIGTGIQCRLRLLWLGERSLGAAAERSFKHSIGRSNETLRLQDGAESAPGARFSG